MSNENRPKETVITESGHEVIIHTYITQEEQRKIQDAFLLAAQSNKSDGTNAIRPRTAADDMAFNLVIVSLDGNADDISGRAVQLPSYEYKELEAIVKGVLELKKKPETSSGNTSLPG